jgi:VWFA-related protein
MLFYVAVAGALQQASFSLSQKSAAPDEPVKLSTQLVVVDAQVLNKKTGAPVGGLTAGDFVLYEEGAKQPITHFSQDELPLSIVLLLDVSASVMPVIDQVRNSGIRALNELKSGDEVALMAFGVWASVLQRFTRERQLISSQISFIDSMGPWIREGTHIDEAIYEAAKYLEQASDRDTRKIIIIVTDNLSTQPENVGHTELETMRQVHAARATVCGLLVGDFEAVTNEYKNRGLHLRNCIGNYLTETGGILSQVDKDDVTAKLARLIERLRSSYSLGYSPLNNKQDGRFRNIQLKVSPKIDRREADLTIVARKGYYAPAQN